MPEVERRASRVRGEFAKYLVVGGVAFVADFGIMFALTEYFAIHYLASATIGFLVGLTINYALSIAWVFETRRLKGRGKSEFAIFAIIGAAGLVLNDSLIWFFTDFVGTHYTVSKLMTTAIVLLWNFLVRRYMLFR